MDHNTETPARRIAIVLGIIGMGIMGIAMPVYRSVLKKERSKVAPEILKLIDEVSKQ